MGIVWAIIITVLGGLFAVLLGFTFLVLAVVGHRSARDARDSAALILSESITVLLYASLIGVIITSCWFPDLYLHYAKPHVWWFLGVLVVSLLVGRMMGGISKSICGVAGSIPDLQSNIIAISVPIFAFETLALVAFIMVWVAPLCIQ